MPPPVDTNTVSLSYVQTEQWWTVASWDTPAAPLPGRRLPAYVHPLPKHPRPQLTRRSWLARHSATCHWWQGCCLQQQPTEGRRAVITLPWWQARCCHKGICIVCLAGNYVIHTTTPTTTCTARMTANLNTLKTTVLLRRRLWICRDTVARRYNMHCFITSARRQGFQRWRDMRAGADLGVTVLLGGGLEVGAGLGGVVAERAAHGPQDAAELVVVLGQLALRHAAPLALRLLQRLLQVPLRVLRPATIILTHVKSLYLWYPWAPLSICSMRSAPSHYHLGHNDNRRI